MADAKAIVNKLVEAEPDPDSPEPYIDWLGQKVDTGPLDKIRFGAYIYTTDEDTIRTNAEEHGVDVENQDFWDAIERDMAIIEANALRILREAGLHVSDEGHSENARVASVWIDTDEEDRKLALLKAVINWAEGDWPSTTSGTMDYAFGAHTTSDLYNNTSEIAQFIDVTIEFTGTDALVEWSKLNLNEAIKGDPDDPEVFLKSYVPRMLGRLLIEFNVIKPHFPDAPTNWYRDNVDGMDLFRYNRVGEMREVMRQMKEYNRQRGERAGIDQVTYRYKVPNPQGHSIVRRWLDKIGCPPTVIQWACETNPPIWFYTRVKEFNHYMQMVYPQVKLDPVVEADEEADPKAYLDAVTGWIDTFIKAGMTADTSEGHEGQWWVKWRLGGAHFWIIVHVRRPIFMQVQVNDALYGRNYMQRTFEFRQSHNNVDQKLLVQWFQLMYRSINNAVKYDRNEPDIVAKLIKKIEGYYDDFKAKQDRGRLGEALDDPEMQRYLDMVTPEQCLHCGNDLTKRHTVVRKYYDRNLRSHELSGHYEGSDGYWTNDEQPSANLIAILPSVATFDDICQRCGTNTAQPVRHEESVDDFDPKGEAMRLMANAPLRYNELRKWRPYIHVPRDNFHNPENYYFTTLIVPVFTATGRLSKAHSWHGWLRMKEFTYDNPPTWEQRVAAVNALVPRYLPGFFPDKLRKRGFQVGVPYEPYEGKFYTTDVQEALDPDDPGVNVERHIASMDIDQIMQRLGFSERKPTWNCADPEYRWFERFTRGLKWTVIRASDEEPHIFEVTLYKLGNTQTVNGLSLPDYQEIGRIKVHIGELEARLGRAIRGRKVREAAELPPEDDPADAVERFAKHTEQVEADALDSAINMAIEEFEIRVRLRGIDNAKDADQLAAEVGNQYAEMAGYHNGSDEYDMVVSAVNNACGEMFPGQWEDYAPPVQEAKAVEWTPERVRDMVYNMFVQDGDITQKEAETYLAAYTPESANQLYQICVEINRNIIDDAKIAQLTGIAVNVIRQANADYAATLKDMTKHIKVDEAVDPDDPEAAIRHAPIQVRAWAVGFHGQHQTQVDFDAGPYFDALANEENGLEMMINLAKEGFAMSNEADRVAAWFSDTTLQDFFKNNTEMGYETHMSQNDVKRWVEHNKPDWYPYLWPKDTMVDKGYDIAEAVDPDDPEAYVRSMETDWRKILRKHGWKPDPHGEHLHFTLEFPDLVWKRPVRIWATHGWAEPPEFHYEHPDPNDPDIDAEDAAYDEWLKQPGNDEFERIRNRDVAFPDYVVFQFDIESYRRIEVPVGKLDTFCARFVREAKNIVGTETVAKVHAGQGLVQMLWEKAKEIARGLKIPLRESHEPPVPVPPEDDIDPKAYSMDLPQRMASYVKVNSNEEAEQRAIEDYEQAKGKVFKVPYLMAWKESDTIEVHGDFVVRVLATDIMDDILRWHDEYLDPVWEVEVLDGPPEDMELLKDTRSHYIDATSYTVTGKVPPLSEAEVPVPPEDEPTGVIKSHEKGLLLPELERLGFTARREKGQEWVYGDEIPRWWYKVYDEANRQALYIYFWGGQTPEVQANVYDKLAQAWFKHGEDSSPRSPAQSQAHLSAIVRDLDAAMQRMTPLNLPVAEQYEGIKRVLAHHRKWWDDTLDYLIQQGNTLPGRMGPGQPA